MIEQQPSITHAQGSASSSLLGLIFISTFAWLFIPVIGLTNSLWAMAALLAAWACIRSYKLLMLAAVLGGAAWLMSGDALSLLSLVQTIEMPYE